MRQGFELKPDGCVVFIAIDFVFIAINFVFIAINYMLGWF